MKISLFFCIVVIINLSDRLCAKVIDRSINNSMDSIANNFKFELKKPYIGLEFFGPSYVVAISYHQQLFQFRKNSFFDLQMNINNRNILLETIQTRLTEENYIIQHYRTHKFAIFFLGRFSLYKPISLSLGLGYLNFQHFKFYDYKVQSDFVILKGSLMINISRNYIISLNAHHIFNRKEPMIEHPLTNFSLSLLVGFNKKDEKANYEKVYGFKKNQLFLNLTKAQLGYERFLLNRQDYNVSTSIAFHIIPFKRFGEYSYKRGYETLIDGMINFNYSLGAKTYSFAGLGAFLNHVSYYVLGDKFQMQTYGLRSNIGLAFKLNEHLAFKLAYTPYITKVFDVNIENLERFMFFRQYKLNAIVSYSF